VTPLPDGHFPPQFIAEVFEEDHVALRFLRIRCLGWN
jgi:hypothetical protein